MIKDDITRDMAREIVYGFLGFLLGGLLGLVGALLIDALMSPLHTAQTGVLGLFAALIVATIVSALSVRFAKWKAQRDAVAIQKPSKYGMGALIGGIALLVLGFNVSIMPVAIFVAGVYAAAKSFRTERADRRQIIMSTIGTLLLFIIVIVSLIFKTDFGLEPFLFNSGAHTNTYSQL
ncbi:MAG: hypothetical protein ACRDHZ_15720 [Ktedonobacteraceae bacterium]